MATNMTKKYAIEDALEKLIKKIGDVAVWSIRRWTNFFTKLPKKKMELQAFIFEMIAFASIGVALIIRWGNL